MSREENHGHLEMIRKALDLIDNRVFEVINEVQLSDAREFISQYRQSHENLSEMISHLADLAGVEEQEEE